MSSNVHNHVRLCDDCALTNSVDTIIICATVLSITARHAYIIIVATLSIPSNFQFNIIFAIIIITRCSPR